jgi:transcriptional regulator with XRE-family HTH domain
VKKGEKVFNHSKLKELMESKSITQAELAYVACVSQAWMSYIANGRRQPSLDVAKRIADKLGVTVDELLTEN